MPLFEVAILEVPTKKEMDEGTGQEILAFGPVPVVSQDGQSAAIKAIMEHPEQAGKVDKAKMLVLVRPFA